MCPILTLIICYAAIKKSIDILHYLLNKLNQFVNTRVCPSNVEILPHLACLQITAEFWKVSAALPKVTNYIDHSQSKQSSKFKTVSKTEQ